MGVNGDPDDIEPGEGLIIDIEAPVFVDVSFGPFQEGDAAPGVIHVA